MSSKRGSTASDRVFPLMVRVMFRVMTKMPAEMTILEVLGVGLRGCALIAWPLSQHGGCDR
jgi:hypothetical protein